MHSSIGSPKTIHFPLVPNGKLMDLGDPFVQNGKLMDLGDPIFKHIRVYLLTTDKQK